MGNIFRDLVDKVKQWLSNNEENKRTVSFTKEDGLWYFDFPYYPFSKNNLLMINGSDKLLDVLARGYNHITLDVYFIETLPEDYSVINTLKLDRTHGNEFSGYYYDVMGNVPFVGEAYFCPVMFFSYGYYPKHIIIDLDTIIIY